MIVCQKKINKNYTGINEGLNIWFTKNRGNRRWVDKRKRRSKYNLCQRIWGDATTFLGGILGKYDKGKLHSTCYGNKTNKRVASKDYTTSHKLGNNYRHTDKKKVESCNDKYNYYATGEEEHDDLVDAIIENDWYGWYENCGGE